RKRKRGLIRHASHQRRDLLEPRTLGGLPPTLARDDFEAPTIDRAHQNRLHDALGLDRLRQFAKRGFVHACARLILAGDEAFDRDRLQRLAVRPVFRSREQRIEAAPQSLELSHGSFLAPWWRGL